MNRLVAVDGNRGSGKTLFIDYMFSKNPCISKECNFWCNLPNTKELELDMLLKDVNDDKRGMVGITESIDLLDNRRSMSDLSKFMYRVTSQSRKIGKDLLIDALLLDTIDWRFLKSCDMIITAWGEHLTDKMNNGFYYECKARIRQIYRINGKMKVAFIWSQPLVKCISYDIFNQIKDTYNTFEVTSTDDSDNLEVAVMSDKKKRVIIDSLAKEILNNKEKYGIIVNKINSKGLPIKPHISHGELLSILLDMKQPSGIEYELHAKINRLLQIEDKV
jgi:hypothetical protein